MADERPLSPAASGAGRLRVPGIDPCPSPTVTYVGWGSLARPRFALGLPNGEVLLGGDEAALFVLDETGLSPTANPTGPTVTNASLDTLGSEPRLWLRTRDGLLHEGPAVLPLQVSPVDTATVPELLGMAAGLAQDGKPEIFALTEDDRLLLDVGGERRVLHTFEVQASITAGGLVRPRPGEAVATRFGSRVPVRYRDGLLDTLPPPSPDLESLGALASDGGYLGASSLGRLFRLEDGGWRERGRGALFELFAILPVLDGAWVGGTNGYLAKLPFGSAACALVPIGGSLIVHLASLAGRQILAVPGGAEPGASELRLAILRFD